MPACKYGDTTCPCQDGDPCHYEEENPMDNNTSTTRMATQPPEAIQHDKQIMRLQCLQMAQRPSFDHLETVAAAAAFEKYVVNGKGCDICDSDELRRVIMFAIGETFICWKATIEGTGEFDRTKAERIGDNLLATIHTLIS